MARPVGVLVLLLTALAIPMRGVQPQVLLLKPNQPIVAADAQLRSQGWAPAGDATLQAFERELAGNRLTSLSGCSGTGAGFCRYDYRRGGQRLEVITVAGPDGNGLVLRWSEAPRLSR
ncbi:hypothetical protein [Vulcanococcus sp.]|uniref:hypothetical protein n=1 Tax=Vulcanococcus sp. TaxID=2856995 RepID=UPI0037D9B81D